MLRKMVGGVGWVMITFLELANVVDATQEVGWVGTFNIFSIKHHATVPQNEMHVWLGVFDVFDRCFQKSLCGNSDTDAPRKKG